MIGFTNKSKVMSIGVMAVLAAGFVAPQAFASSDTSPIILNQGQCKNLFHGFWDNTTNTCGTVSGVTLASDQILVIPAGTTLNEVIGTLNNYGTIYNFGNLNIIQSGTLNNYGTINNYPGATITVDCISTFTGNPVNNQGGTVNISNIC